MKHIHAIYTENAPDPGLYNQGILVDLRGQNFLFLSGQTGNIPLLQDQPVAKGLANQTLQTLENILAVVVEAGGDADSLVSLDVFLKDGGTPEARKESRETFNQVYRNFFETHHVVYPKKLPARTMVWVPEVPLEYPAEDTLVEIRAIAAVPLG